MSSTSQARQCETHEESKKTLPYKRNEKNLNKTSGIVVDIRGDETMHSHIRYNAGFVNTK